MAPSDAIYGAIYPAITHQVTNQSGVPASFSAHACNKEIRETN